MPQTYIGEVVDQLNGYRGDNIKRDIIAKLPGFNQEETDRAWHTAGGDPYVFVVCDVVICRSPDGVWYAPETWPES